MLTASVQLPVTYRCTIRPRASFVPLPLRHPAPALPCATAAPALVQRLAEMLQCCSHKGCNKEASVLDVLFVKDDTLEHIIERLVVLLQVNVVVYIHLYGVHEDRENVIF
jgi:hypothetical protein